MNANAPLKTNTTALLAAFAGVLGFCFWGIGGVLAIVLGLAARAEIARSAGREGGNAAAIVGIVLGGVNIASCIIGVAVGIALLARPAAPAPMAHPTPAPVPVPTTVPSSRRPNRTPPENASREQAVREAMFGSVRVVDVTPAADKSLRRILEAQHKAASDADERLILFVVAADCLPCNGFMLALGDKRMQSALRQVRLVRVDANEYAPELSALGIPTDTIPGFALIAGGRRVSDYVDGGEWDADIAQNIAPVLGAFIQGKYRVRRHRFRGEERADETAL
ncbi:MAG: DUF4190 domain-containing protein [Myxococcota bacterium]